MAEPNWKEKPWRSQEYTDFISAKPCCIKKTPGPNDPHHEQLPGHGTMGGKCGDDRQIPLRHDLHVELEAPGNSRPAFWAKYGVDPEQVVAKYNAEWIALGNNFDESSSKPKPKRRARPVRGRPMAKKKPEPEIEVRCAICDHLHGTFTKKTIPKGFICTSCSTGQKVEKPDWVSHTKKRNYPEGALQ